MARGRQSWRHLLVVTLAGGIAGSGCDRDETEELPEITSLPSAWPPAPLPIVGSAAPPTPWFEHPSVKDRYVVPDDCPAPPEGTWPAAASPHWKGMRKRCEAGTTKDCRLLGIARWHGTGGPGDAVHALQLFRNACDGGDRGSCALAAKLYSRGTGTPRSTHCAEAYGKRAGDDKPEQWPFSHPEEEHQRHCDAGEYPACVDAHYPWQGTEAFDQVRPYCEAGLDHGCWVMRRFGASTKLAEVYEKACRHGSLHACSELLYPDRSKHRAITKAYDKPPEPLFPLSDRAATCAAACDHGLGRACRERAEATRGPSAAAYWARSCAPYPRDHEARDIDAGSCRAWGDWLRQQGGPDAAYRAAAAYQRGCYVPGAHVWGREEACVALAELLETGDGLPRDPLRSIDLFAGLCSIGSQHCRGFKPCTGWGCIEANP
ncbi:MAG: sel1 repeat family protein [Deltaproteobacteria bacterium]|nr:sel1 repeat family protein [Deltaproteobacteria bacterium]